MRMLASSPPATPEEAAAIVAAIERFMRATAPAQRATGASEQDGWRAAAVLEGVSRNPWADADGWLRTSA